MFVSKECAYVCIGHKAYSQWTGIKDLHLCPELTLPAVFEKCSLHTNGSCKPTCYAVRQASIGWELR